MATQCIGLVDSTHHCSIGFVSSIVLDAFDELVHGLDFAVWPARYVEFAAVLLEHCDADVQLSSSFIDGLVVHLRLEER